MPIEWFLISLQNDPYLLHDCIIHLLIQCNRDFMK